MPTRTAIVVPCYNESHRLRVAEFERFLEAGEPEVVLIFVDDGSRDDTAAILKRLQGVREDRAVFLPLARNQGKAEAVRHGMQYAFDRGFPYAGFWDADLATPLDAIAGFRELLDQRPELEMVFGARVKLLGRHVERKPSRHYIGRVFATAVSIILRLPIYDTQCGAKMFRSTPEIRAAFAAPFLSRWIFDVEIIARYLAATKGADVSQRIYEYPLQTWTDIKGSKLKAHDFGRAAYDLARIYRKYLR